MTDQKTPNTDHAIPTLVTDQNSAHLTDPPSRQAWIRRFWPLIASCLLSIIWIGICIWWFMESGKTLARMPIYEAGGLLAGASLPLILVWLIALVYLRTDPLRDHRTALTRGMNDLFAPLDAVQQRVNSIVAELHKQIKQVEGAGDVATTRIDNLEKRFQEQISNLFEVTTDAEVKATNLQEKLSGEREAFAGLVADVTVHVAELENMFKQIKFDSETITNITRKNSQDITAEISHQNEALAERSKLVGEQLEIISGELSNISQDISENCTISESRLTDISQKISEKQASLSETIAGLSDHADRICEKMAHQSTNIADLSQKTAEHSQSITETLHKQESDLSSIAKEAQAQTLKARDILDGAAENFKTKAEGIVESSQTLADNLIGHMGRATEDLDVKSDILDHTIAARVSRMQETLEKQTGIIQENLAETVTSFEEQAMRIDGAVRMTTDNMDKNTRQMTAHCDTFEQLAEKFRDQVDRSEIQLKTQHDDLIKSLTDVTEHLEGALLNLKEQSGDLGDHSQQVISNIVEQTGQLSGHIDDIRTRTEKTIRNIQDMGETVSTHFTATDAQAAALSENWVRTASLVENQCADTLSRLDGLASKLAEIKQENTQAADVAEENVTKVADQMQQASESIYLASASAVEAADETNRVIDQHTEKFQQLINALQLSNKSILADAKTIEQKSRNQHGSQFSKLASKIIEQLQSLSIDINRYFEDDVPDKIWQAYVDGDKNAFMRRLKKITNKKYTEAIRKKYKNDSEFRKYALEYIQIFEDLMSQSMISDNYSTFSVALISSETGKVYLALAQATNRFSA